MNNILFSFRYRKPSLISSFIRLLLRACADHFFLRRRDKTLAIVSNGYVSRDLLLFNDWEPELSELYKVLSKAGYNKAFIDIGANIGASSVSATSFYSKVISFEPSNFSFYVLKANSILYSNIVAYNYAIASTEKDFSLVVPTADLGSSYLQDIQDHNMAIEGAIPVETVTAINRSTLRQIFIENNILDDPFVVIKVDTEGFEVPVIEELSYSFNTCNAAFIVEISSEASLRRILNILNRDISSAFAVCHSNRCRSRFSKIIKTMFRNEVTLQRLKNVDGSAFSISFPVDILILP